MGNVYSIAFNMSSWLIANHREQFLPALTPPTSSDVRGMYDQFAKPVRERNEALESENNMRARLQVLGTFNSLCFSRRQFDSSCQRVLISHVLVWR
jgi:hypothetical protein